MLTVNEPEYVIIDRFGHQRIFYKGQRVEMLDVCQRLNEDGLRYWLFKIVDKEIKHGI